MSLGSGTWPSGRTSALPRTGVWPVCRPVMIVEREGAQTDEPE